MAFFVSFFYMLFIIYTGAVILCLLQLIAFQASDGNCAYGMILITYRIGIFPEYM